MLQQYESMKVWKGSIKSWSSLGSVPCSLGVPCVLFRKIPCSMFESKNFTVFFGTRSSAKIAGADRDAVQIDSIPIPIFGTTRIKFCTLLILFSTISLIRSRSATVVVFICRAGA